MGYNFESNLLKASFEKEDIKIAKKEWCYVYYEKKTNTNKSFKCICNQCSKIMEHRYYFVNKVLKNKFIGLGSSCVMEFDDKIGKIRDKPTTKFNDKYKNKLLFDFCSEYSNIEDFELYSEDTYNEIVNFIQIKITDNEFNELEDFIYCVKELRDKYDINRFDEILNELEIKYQLNCMCCEGFNVNQVIQEYSKRHYNSTNHMNIVAYNKLINSDTISIICEKYEIASRIYYKNIISENEYDTIIQDDILSNLLINILTKWGKSKEEFLKNIKEYNNHIKQINNITEEKYSRIGYDNIDNLNKIIKHCNGTCTKKCIEINEKINNFKLYLLLKGLVDESFNYYNEDKISYYNNLYINSGGDDEQLLYRISAYYKKYDCIKKCIEEYGGDDDNYSYRCNVNKSIFINNYNNFPKYYEKFYKNDIQNNYKNISYVEFIENDYIFCFVVDNELYNNNEIKLKEISKYYITEIINGKYEINYKNCKNIYNFINILIELNIDFNFEFHGTPIYKNIVAFKYIKYSLKKIYDELIIFINDNFDFYYDTYYDIYFVETKKIDNADKNNFTIFNGDISYIKKENIRMKEKYCKNYSFKYICCLLIKYKLIKKNYQYLNISNEKYYSLKSVLKDNDCVYDWYIGRWYINNDSIYYDEIKNKYSSS